MFICTRAGVCFCATALLVLLGGCGDSGSSSGSSGALERAASTKAMSLLKKYQVAQSIHRVQSDGAYGAMKELVSSELIDGELAHAFDKQPAPVAVDGYLFSDIDQDSDGRPLELHRKAGLCAYPQDRSGTVILMLMDSNDPEEWAYYTSDCATTGGAVRRWPSTADLKDKFTRAGKYSPQEAKKEAEKLAK